MCGVLSLVGARPDAFRTKVIARLGDIVRGVTRGASFSLIICVGLTTLKQRQQSSGVARYLKESGFLPKFFIVARGNT